MAITKRTKFPLIENLDPQGIMEDSIAQVFHKMLYMTQFQSYLLRSLHLMYQKNFRFCIYLRKFQKLFKSELTKYISCCTQTIATPTSNYYKHPPPTGWWFCYHNTVWQKNNWPQRRGKHIFIEKTEKCNLLEMEVFRLEKVAWE